MTRQMTANTAGALLLMITVCNNFSTADDGNPPSSQIATVGLGSGYIEMCSYLNASL